ncbi:MAG: hypothetical protein AB1589_34060, partial [Cyanobacteriota bacterium]
GNFGNRYAYLDTYACVNCGYVENYVVKPEDLNYIKGEWTLVREQNKSDSNSVSDRQIEDSGNLGFIPLH